MTLFQNRVMMLITGFRNLCVFEVNGLMQVLNDLLEQDYSMALRKHMITEAQMELFCDDTQVNQVVDLIRMHARTGQQESGRMYVRDVTATYAIDNPSACRHLFAKPDGR